MATKSVKSPPKKAAPAADPQDALAHEVLTTLLHRALVRLGEPARAADIAREVNEEAVTPALARSLMETQPRRFIAIDRRWDLAARYLDKQRPVSRTLEEIVAVYGAPIPTDEVPGELAHIYGRVREHFNEVAPRMLRGPHFFAVRGGMSFGLRAWLLDTNAQTDADLLFINYLSEDKVAPFQTIAAGLDWESDPVGAALVLAGEAPLDNRLGQYFAFKAQGEDFDGVALYTALVTDGRLLALPEHRWLPVSALEPLRAKWRASAQAAGESAPAEEAITPEAIAVAAQPLSVTDEDLEDLARYLDGRDEFIAVPQMLTDVLDVRVGAANFAEDAAILTDTLKSHPSQFLWVGTDRFRAPSTLPPYIGQLPESLTFPTLPRFETADGEILDQPLDEAAFEEDLVDAIYDPVAQDVNDQESGDKTRWPEGATADATSLRLVLKSHHKEIGTFPLAQIPEGFLPTGPRVTEISVRDADGSISSVYIDYDAQLLYGLFEPYMNIAADSGGVFFLDKTEEPADFIFRSEGETDNGVFVSPARMEELTELRNAVESGPAMSTYDIVRTTLEHYKKGLSFLALLTEVNLVRRTPRRLLASILSGYSAFHPRAARWTFDAKKEPEGFNTAKRGYILKK